MDKEAALRLGEPYFFKFEILLTLRQEAPKYSALVATLGVMGLLVFPMQEDEAPKTNRPLTT